MITIRFVLGWTDTMYSLVPNSLSRATCTNGVPLTQTDHAVSRCALSHMLPSQTNIAPSKCDDGLSLNRVKWSCISAQVVNLTRYIFGRDIFSVDGHAPVFTP
jgi:hypothetical protein